MYEIVFLFWKNESKILVEKLAKDRGKEGVPLVAAGL
jgi:hypothetical protein